ncbi:derepression protein [Escherichia coli]|nr:derepression protein [Escherichia coli]
MANRRQQRVRAEHLRIRTEINRRLFRASRVAKIMHINMLHERTHALSNRYCAAVFSYLADDLAELQDLISQQHHH